MAGRGKPASRDAIRPAAGRTRKPELALAGKLEMPDPPAGLLEETEEWWRAYWSSDLARAVQNDTDLPSLSRLAWLMDERLRSARALRTLSTPVSMGSQGQAVLHPLTKYIGQLDAEIRQLEDRFGLNPRARIALGIELTKARRSLDDLYDDEKGKVEPSLEVLDGADLG